MRDVASRLAEVRLRVARAAERARRDPASVLLVAVTKDVAAERIPAALFTDLGENRVAELLDKQAGVRAPGLRWHLVGRLQRNKAPRVTGRVTLIHSVDNLRLAETIARRALARQIRQDVLIEVNTSGEHTKAGVQPAEARALALSVAELEGVLVRGFMTIGPPDEPERARACFAALRSIRDEVHATIPTASELSMGMTGDFEIAVEEGSTIVRIGTAIFGARAPAR